MCQGFDHPAGGAVRELRVAVQRYDEPHVRKTVRVADEYQTRGIFRPRPIDQAVELLQLSSFALPTNILLLGFTPSALPMEKEESLTTIPLIETLEAVDCSLKQWFVVHTMRLVRVGVVRE
jgi:hypothetical protein